LQATSVIDGHVAVAGSSSHGQHVGTIGFDGWQSRQEGRFE
jgi:hypothetical protein